MKAEPLQLTDGRYSICDADEATHVRLCMHGHYENRIIPVGREQSKGVWKWNFDTESPTLTPSILTSDDRHRCHSYVQAGRVRYLSDSTHEFSGKNLPLNDID